jgi:hypothetical protein
MGVGDRARSLSSHIVCSLSNKSKGVTFATSLYKSSVIVKKFNTEGAKLAYIENKS